MSRAGDREFMPMKPGDEADQEVARFIDLMAALETAAPQLERLRGEYARLVIVEQAAKLLARVVKRVLPGMLAGAATRKLEAALHLLERAIADEEIGDTEWDEEWW